MVDDDLSVNQWTIVVSSSGSPLRWCPVDPFKTGVFSSIVFVILNQNFRLQLSQGVGLRVSLATLLYKESLTVGFEIGNRWTE